MQPKLWCSVVVCCPGDGPIFCSRSQDWKMNGQDWKEIKKETAVKTRSREFSHITLLLKKSKPLRLEKQNFTLTFGHFLKFDTSSSPIQFRALEFSAPPLPVFSAFHRKRTSFTSQFNSHIPRELLCKIFLDHPNCQQWSRISSICTQLLL